MKSNKGVYQQDMEKEKKELTLQENDLSMQMH